MFFTKRYQSTYNITSIAWILTTNLGYFVLDPIRIEECGGELCHWSTSPIDVRNSSHELGGTSLRMAAYYTSKFALFREVEMDRMWARVVMGTFVLEMSSKQIFMDNHLYVARNMTQRSTTFAG